MKINCMLFLLRLEIICLYIEPNLDNKFKHSFYIFIGIEEISVVSKKIINKLKIMFIVLKLLL